MYVDEDVLGIIVAAGAVYRMRKCDLNDNHKVRVFYFFLGQRYL